MDFRWVITAMLPIVCLQGRAVEPAAPPIADVSALLEASCVRCHNAEKPKGGLDLSTREGLLKGGENGPAIVAGKADTSLLIRSVRHLTDSPMPHKEKKLSDKAIAQLAAWVQAGAPYSRPLKDATATRPAAGFVLTDADRSHRAFQPVKRPVIPSSAALGSANPIDQFIVAKLHASGLKLSAPADKATLLRRVTLDLIGLPPTPAEVDAFIADASADAYEKVIDRLLASPHYGERWGRHWLDLARFAETDGFEFDAVRPNSWRYRDYVIRSFNADKPYDRFVREQVAGDELWPDDADAHIATGFNLLGPDMVDSSDQVQRHHNTLNDMTDTTALAFLGLTMGCCRCHDHKFEPLAQRDYYSLQAFFTPAKFDRAHPIPSEAERAAHEAAMAKFNEQPEVRELLALEAPVREKLRLKKLAKLPTETRIAHETLPEQRNSEQANLVFETLDMVKVSDKEVAEAIPKESKTHRGELVASIKKLGKATELPMAMSLVDTQSPVKTFVLTRGEYSQPAEEVEPAFPQVVAHGARSATGRRSDLAEWIASPANPLTARVMVNRVWQHHFGRGLVGSPSDFGTHGQAPSHPELLDWLASEFMSRGWSIKKMHKLMLMSATYQQASAPSESARRADPENRLYSHMNRLRLEGEVIRDNLLAVSGQLNAAIGGPSIFPPLPADASKGAKGGWPVNDQAALYRRRSVYIFARRNLRFPFLDVFDAPDSNLSCPAREKSITAPQSLALLNADDVMISAKATADRLAKGASGDDRIVLAYRLALGRLPQAGELRVAREFLAQSPLSEFCRALFNLNEFVYVE